ncbi:MAG: PEP-CTERM sorting domain-containing protein [Phenylobacterium sp.]|nr:PEP-CTERM sorting domain-containing protein [Phenylobacterium sp.]
MVPDAGAAQSYSHDYGTAFSGGLAGLALYQGGRADNFGTDGAVGGGGVPEPATWALLVLGFGAAGATMRRRRAALAA